MLDDKVISLKLLKPNLKLLAIPLSVILILIVVLIIAIPVGISRIRTDYKKLQDANAQENQLREKLGSLQQVQSDVLPNSTSVLLAIPDRNPATLRISHIRQIVQNNENISIRGISSSIRGNQELEDIHNMELTIRYSTNDIINVIPTVKNIETTSPLTTLKELSIDEDDISQDTLEVLATYDVYWSELPTTLSKISEPVIDLTSTEEELLTMIINLRLPEFINLPSSENPQRTDPFH